MMPITFSLTMRFRFNCNRLCSGFNIIMTLAWRVRVRLGFINHWRIVMSRFHAGIVVSHTRHVFHVAMVF